MFIYNYVNRYYLDIITEKLICSLAFERMSFIARYVYTYKEFVIVTEAPQCNKMTATGEDTDNKIIIYK